MHSQNDTSIKPFLDVIPFMLLFKLKLSFSINWLTYALQLYVIN